MFLVSEYGYIIFIYFFFVKIKRIGFYKNFKVIYYVYRVWNILIDFEVEFKKKIIFYLNIFYINLIFFIVNDEFIYLKY